MHQQCMYHYTKLEKEQETAMLIERHDFWKEKWATDS